MHAAFWRGVAFLNESGSDTCPHQGSMAGPSGTLKDTEGFTEIPKNAMLLRPSIGQLMDKVAQSFV